MGQILALLGGLATVVGPLVTRVLIALGISFVTYKGFDLLVGSLLTLIKANLSAMPVDIVNFLGWLWVDKAIGMVFSAYAATIAVRAAGGSITKMVTKGAP